MIQKHIIGSMKQTVLFFIIINIVLSVSSTSAIYVHANDGQSTVDQGKNNVYESEAFSILNKMKKAMPTAPPGWVVAGETIIDSFPGSENDAARQSYHFAYQIQYRRVTGVKEEKKKLNEVYIESSERHGEEANTQINDLLRQQTAAALALRKATRHKNQAEIERLNDELEDNGRKMRAIHEDVDNKIGRDVAPYLLKDTEAIIEIVEDDEKVEGLYGEPLSVSNAVFAFRSEGEQKGPMIWQEGKTVVLFGPWQQAGNGVYRCDILHKHQSQRAQSIKITITGARNRALELLNQMDQNALLSLIK